MNQEFCRERKHCENSSRAGRSWLFFMVIFSVMQISACSKNNPDDGTPPKTEASSINAVFNVLYSGTLETLDHEPPPLTYFITKNPEHGEIDLLDSATGEFTYLPTTNDNVTDTFVYKVNNGFADSKLAVVTIHISSDALDAVNDTFTVLEGDTLGSKGQNKVFVTDNDSFGAIAQVVLDNGPTFASSFTLDSDGSFVYTHNGDEVTQDSFTYHLDNGEKQSAVATVTFTITPVNDAPVAVADNPYTLTEGATLNVSAALGVMANDYDPEGDAFSAILMLAPTNAASFSFAADGSFSYSHNGSETVSDSFSYALENNAGQQSNLIQVQLSISPSNDAPVAMDDSFSGTLEGGTLSVVSAQSILNNDFDPENSSFTAEVITGPAFSNSFVFDSNGTFTYTHDGSENLTDSFTYRIYDGVSFSPSATVSIALTPVNDPPVAVASCWPTPKAAVINGTINAADPDDPGAQLSYIQVGIAPRKGDVTVFTNGQFEYTPDLASRGGTDTFSYQVTDLDGRTDTGTVTVIIDYKIMPLGDSITMGATAGVLPDSEKVGYRKNLYGSLTSAGYNFDFVGTRQHGSFYIPDDEHDGHGGWSAFQIANGHTGDVAAGSLPDWLVTSNPDIVLLHVGTNGLDPNNDADVNQILDQIDTWEASNHPVTVIIARIIEENTETLENHNLGFFTPNPDTETFNDNVVALVQDRIVNDGDDIIIVNQQIALDYPADLDDLLHPKASGYAKMADIWLHPLAGQGTPSGTGTADDTGKYIGAGIMDKCN